MSDHNAIVDYACSNPTKSNYRIAEVFGCHEKTVRTALKEAGYKRHLLPVDQTPGRFAFEMDQPLMLYDEDVMITADWHIPLYDPVYVNGMIEQAREFAIKKLVIAGDFFNFDALSQYEPKHDEAGLEREWKEGLGVMQVLLETFDTIFYLWGNHDERLNRALGHKMRFAEAMRMTFGLIGEQLIERIEFTNLDHMWVHNGIKSFYICHPANYSRVPLSTPRALAAKMGSTVICAHAHHAAVGYAADGHNLAVEAGGLFDAHKTAYLQRSTTFPRWTQGYAMLLGDRLILSSPGFGAGLV